LAAQELPAMKILVVEDEVKTSAFLRNGLTENGFAVDVCRHGEDGLQRAKSGDYDLMILDVMLPQRDGWSILSDLRQSGNLLPTIFLTARDAVQDRVKGLEIGADDYLVKPFAFSELLARVRSTLRRSTGVPTEIVRVGDLEVETLRQRATRRHQRLELTPKEFALLSLLSRHTGEVLSRAYLAEQVWDMKCEGDSNVVDVHIRRLRSKVDDPFPQKLIHTVRGLGYVLENRI
jgi:two-component system copper resistance phosphate regulon response regulator CusR